MANLGQEQFMVMAFTEPQPEGSAFQVWPQHMTVALWMKGYRLQATTRIADAVAGWGPLKSHLIGEGLLGEDEHETQVWFVDKQPQVVDLHHAVMAAAHRNGTKSLGLKADNDYLPHISQQAAKPPHEVGDSLLLPTMSIVGHHMGRKTVFTSIAL